MQNATLMAATGAGNGGFGTSATSRSRAGAAFVILHAGPQHGIDACIDAAFIGLAMQQTVAAGCTLIRSASATTIAVTAFLTIAVYEEVQSQTAHGGHGFV